MANPRLQTRRSKSQLPLRPKPAVPAFPPAHLVRNVVDTTLSDLDLKPDALSLRLGTSSSRGSRLHGLQPDPSRSSDLQWERSFDSLGKCNAFKTGFTGEITILPSSMFEESLQIRQPKGPPLLAQSRCVHKSTPSLSWLKFAQLFDKAESNFRDKLRKNKQKPQKPVRKYRRISTYLPVYSEKKGQVTRVSSHLDQKKQTNKRKLDRVQSLKEEIRRSEDLKRSDSEAILRMKSVKSLKKSLSRLPICLKR